MCRPTRSRVSSAHVLNTHEGSGRLQAMHGQSLSWRLLPAVWRGRGWGWTLRIPSR